MIIFQANKLDDLRNKILTKFGFKRLWIEKHGKSTELWGEFNPKVLLMKQDGTITSENLTLEQIDEIKLRRGDKRVVGEKLNDGGIVVSDSFADDFVNNRTKHSFDDLKNMDADEIRRISDNRQSTAQLRQGISHPQPKYFQAHHIIPRELKKTFNEFFEKIGFNIENGAINGIMIPPSEEVLKVAKLDVDIPIGNQFDNYVKHLGSHPNYTELIERKMIQIRSNYNNGIITKSEALNEIKTLIDKARIAISNGKNKTINQITF